MALTEPASPPAAAPGRSLSDRRIFGCLRSLRAASQYLEQQLSTPGDSTTPCALLSTSDLREIITIFNANLHEIERIFEQDPTQAEWCADNITTIRLLWHHLLRDCERVPKDATERSALLQHVLENLDTIVFHCASLTLTARVNDVMANLRIGQPLDLEFQFADELPRSPELRTRILSEIAQQAAAVEGGLVDIDQGVIYRATLTRKDQLWSFLRLTLFLLAGALIPILLARVSRYLPGWRFTQHDLLRLLADYVFILLGSGAHLAIALLKAVKTDTRPNFKTVEDWLLWLHIRESQVYKGFLSVWIGFLLLVFAMPNLEWSSAFFAGYSIDSVTELFLERFETVALNRKKELLA